MRFHSYKAVLFSGFLISLILFSDALAQGIWTNESDGLEDIGKTVCDGYELLTRGNAARAIATLSVMGLGFAALAGKVTLPMAIIVAVSIAGIFGSFAVSNTITSRTDDCDAQRARVAAENPDGPPASNQQPGRDPDEPLPCFGHRDQPSRHWNIRGPGPITIETDINVLEDDNYIVEIRYHNISAPGYTADFSIGSPAVTATNIPINMGLGTYYYPLSDRLFAGRHTLQVTFDVPAGGGFYLYAIGIWSSGC